VLDQLLDRSDALPLGDRAGLGRIVALCDDRSATAEGLRSRRRGTRASRRSSSGSRTAPTREASPACRARIGVEPVVEPTPAALDLVCVFDLDAASARLQPPLEAQERFDSRVHAEPIAPANLPEGFAEAIDQLR
jgi:hypothetical protein